MEINFAKIEKKWQNKWEKDKAFVAIDNSKKPKYYCLEMFPYPSGDGLHMGHAWNYVIGDILARFKIMSGFNVLHPMGYDALGLPAENAAIKAKTHPEDYTKKSIKNFTKQQKEIGISYDWSRVINTADPSYYKWDQWIFLKMLEKSLAYQKESAVNWCPKCDTVLANEQVHDGKCWRHEDTNVEVKHLTQWFLKTTAYADELYENINKLDWPERTKAMQKNWIGKSHGTEINFKINNEVWPIFTTRSDTIHGVTFMVVSAQHKKLNELVTEEQKKEVKNFQKQLGSVSEKDLETMDKLGVFTGSYAINPINNEKVPVYAGNFVVADYGAGMVMAVPAHDQRDFEFAKKYNIPIRQVIDGEITKTRAYTGPGKLMNSDEFDDLYNKDAKEKITKYLNDKKLGKKVTNFKLRDWGISRQRYWGTPIPIIHCEKCEAVPVAEKDLPVKLPKDVKFGKGNPLETNDKWINTKCPKCNGKAKRETDTMDTFVNSSWYFLRYADPNNVKKIFDEKKVKHWCPVDTYIGGAEHACMHLIYSRFYTKFLRDLGLIDFDEPAKKLFHQGMLLGEGGIKMSKSKGNGVLPEVVSKKYGIDTARFFMSSLASPDKDIDWSEKGINGSSKFINKMFEFFNNYKQDKDSEETKNKLNKTIANVTKYYDKFEYRKATIEIRELFDLIIKQDSATKETLEKSLQLLNPICPHITEELYEKLGNKKLISTSDWPNAGKITKTKSSTENLSEKTIEQIKTILTKVNKEKVFIYVMPFELKKLNKEKIAKETGKKIEVFSTANKDKHDPENKSKRAKPGMASIYLE